jgi:hypothetical protein
VCVHCSASALQSLAILQFLYRPFPVNCGQCALEAASVPHGTQSVVHALLHCMDIRREGLARLSSEPASPALGSRWSQ